MGTAVYSLIKKKRRALGCRGFSLVELLVSLAIMSLLLSFAMPLAEIVRQRSQESELRLALRQIRDAIDEYKRASDAGRIERDADGSGYPPTLRILVEGVKAKKIGDGPVVYFLRRIPRDPTYPDASVPADKTWGARSYDSSFEHPAPGKDVFDIFSLSDGVGLDGIPYREW